jgi:hypothetical protein
VKPLRNNLVKHTLLILLASCTFASAQTWCWTNIAGSLSANGDVDGTGDAARFSQLYGIDINGAGNLLVVCDRGASKIKTITLPGGVVTTVQSGYNLVQCVINKNNGNLYFPDINGGGTIYRLPAPYTGTPTPIASDFFAFGLGIDNASDTLYLAAQNGHAIYYIPNAGAATPGPVIHLAGSGTQGMSNSDLASSTFRNPMGMAVIVAGGNTNIYVADRANHAIRKIDVGANQVTTVAGGTQGTQDGVGTAAQFSQPHNVVMGPDGHLYVCDQDNYTVRKISMPDTEVTTIMGVNQNANNNGGATEGCGADALNGNLGQITIDSTGHIYTADRASAANSFAHVMKGTAEAVTQPNITKISFQTVVTGTDYCWTNFAGGFSSPYGADTDSANNIYVADRGAGVVRKVLPNGSVSTLNALTGDLVEIVVNKVNGNIYYPSLGPGELKKSVPPYTSITTHASFTASSVIGLGVDSAADIVYVSDMGTHQIFRVDSTGAKTVLAGSGTAGFGNDTLTAATFRNPAGIAVVGTGTNAILYVADRENHAIRKIDIAANAVTTLAGSGSAGCVDATGTEAQFFAPTGVTLGPDGNLYVADQDNGSIRKVTPAGVVTKIGGNCTAGTAADGCGEEAHFGNIGQVAVDSSGNVYPADRGSSSMKRGIPPLSGQVVQIDFTAGASDTASMFTLQSSANVGGTYGDVTAIITELGGGLFRAQIAPSGSRQFYRITR